MEEQTSKLIFLVITLVGFGLILGSVYVMADEILTAKEFCKSVDGEYKLKVLRLEHYCNGEQLTRFTDGWRYKSTEELMSNFSDIFP